MQAADALGRRAAEGPPDPAWEPEEPAARLAATGVAWLAHPERPGPAGEWVARQAPVQWVVARARAAVLARAEVPEAGVEAPAAGGRLADAAARAGAEAPRAGVQLADAAARAGVAARAARRSPVAALLGVAGADFDELYARWVEFAAPSHPFSRDPYVPGGRFCRVSPTGIVRADLEGTGPIGWASGDDVAALARDIAAVADEQPAFAAELRAVSTRIESAARRGHAVIGLIEYLPPEADGQRTWLVE